MKLLPSDRQRIEKQFDHYCKIVIAGKKKDINRHKFYISQHERTFSDLTINEYNQLSSMDKYSVFNKKISADGYTFEIEDDLLFEALSFLPEEKRKVVLLSYWLDMTDEEIAQDLNIVRSTINYMKISSINSMRRFLEANNYDE